MEREPNKYAQCLLSILDSLKLHDNGSLWNGETLSETMWRKMEAYGIDLNEELGFTHLSPVKKEESHLLGKRKNRPKHDKAPKSDKSPQWGQIGHNGQIGQIGHMRA